MDVQGMKKIKMRLMKSWGKKMKDYIIKVLIYKSEELKSNPEKPYRSAVVEYKINGSEGWKKGKIMSVAYWLVRNGSTVSAIVWVVNIKAGAITSRGVHSFSR